jgi:hypothetical protein
MMEQGRPARETNHEAGKTPALQRSFTLTRPDPMRTEWLRLAEEG